MRCLLLAASLTALAAAPALAQDVPECTTTTTTTTTCKGSAAPLAAPAPEREQYAYPMPAPVPPPAAYYPPPLLPPVQLQMKTIERPRVGLIVAGSVIFAASYLLNAAAAYLGADATLAIPIVGPVVFAGAHQTASDDDNRIINFWMALDTIVQASGLAMAILGAVLKTKVRVFDRVAFAPMGSSSGGGFALAGRF